MIDADALQSLLASRRSVRAFKPEAPPDALLARLVEMAILAPSASNKQPWRFVVVTSRAVIASSERRRR